MVIGELTTFKHLESFGNHDFQTWYMRMQFMLEGLDLPYVLNEPRSIVDLHDENREIDIERSGMRWDVDDYACCGLILKGLADWLFEIFHHNEIAAALMDSLDLVHFGKVSKHDS